MKKFWILKICPKLKKGWFSNFKVAFVKSKVRLILAIEAVLLYVSERHDSYHNNSIVKDICQNVLLGIVESWFKNLDEKVMLHYHLKNGEF